MADKVKIGTMWFGGCSGCHLSIADFHESLIDVMEFADFEFSPVLMCYGICGFRIFPCAHGY